MKDAAIAIAPIEMREHHPVTRALLGGRLGDVERLAGQLGVPLSVVVRSALEDWFGGRTADPALLSRLGIGEG